MLARGSRVRSHEAPGNVCPRWMATQDRIRLTACYRRGPAAQLTAGPLPFPRRRADGRWTDARPHCASTDGRPPRRGVERRRMERSLPPATASRSPTRWGWSPIPRAATSARRTGHRRRSQTRRGERSLCDGDPLPRDRRPSQPLPPAHIGRALDPSGRGAAGAAAASTPPARCAVHVLGAGGAAAAPQTRRGRAVRSRSSWCPRAPGRPRRLLGRERIRGRAGRWSTLRGRTGLRLRRISSWRSGTRSSRRIPRTARGVILELT